MWNTLALTITQQCANLRFMLNTQAVRVPLLDVIEMLEYAVSVEPKTRVMRKAAVMMIIDSINDLNAYCGVEGYTVVGGAIDIAVNAILADYNNYAG